MFVVNDFSIINMDHVIEIRRYTGENAFAFYGQGLNGATQHISYYKARAGENATETLKKLLKAVEDGKKIFYLEAK